MDMMIGTAKRLSGKKMSRVVETNFGRRYDIRIVEDLIGRNVGILAERVRSRSALLVVSRRVHELYGRILIERLRESGVDIPSIVIDCSEAGKSTRQVEAICEEAQRRNLDRKGLLIALGGGICGDVVTVAASWIRRGIRYMRIPTTLIGQVDAGIGIKGAVNFRGRKSYVGAFYPPESVCIDPAFLKTLPQRYLSCGIAEIVKMAIVRDERLFGLVENHSGDLLHSGFSDPEEESREILWRSASRMTEELETNIYEDKGYQRLVDFGHTFSPLLESASGFRMHHGEAVAIDMALTCGIAGELGYLDRATRERVIACLLSADLPVYSPLLTERLCMNAFEETMRHRGGAVNLVVPTGLGTATFLEQSEEVSLPSLRTALRWLSGRSSRTVSISLHPACCLVFDVGGTSIRAGLYDDRSDSLSRVIERKTAGGPGVCGKTMTELVDGLVTQMQSMAAEILEKREPRIVSIAFAGPIGRDRTVLAAPTIWGSAQDRPVDLIGPLLRCWKTAHIHIMNDVSAAGYRYLRPDSQDYCVVTVSSGIGNKVFVQGRPVTGQDGHGGEIGHLQVDWSPDAPVCDCGGRGHLGAVSSGRGTLALAKQRARSDPGAFRHSELGWRCGAKADLITNEGLAEAYRNGDPWAEGIIRDAMRPLAQTLAFIHLGIGIERFIIIGGFARALGDRYRADLVRTATMSGWHNGKDWEEMIQPGFPDDNCGLIGAGRFATRNWS